MTDYIFKISGIASYAAGTIYLGENYSYSLAIAVTSGIVCFGAFIAIFWRFISLPR